MRALKDEKNFIYVIGAGGNGSILTKLLSQYLSRQQFKYRTHMTIVDKDVVEDHNLERQEFSLFDIGSLKCKVLKERCLSQGYKNVTYSPEYIHAKMIYDLIKNSVGYSSQINLHIFNCVDNNESRHQLHSSLFYIEDGKSHPIWSRDFPDVNLIIYDLGNADTYGQVVVSANIVADIRKTNHRFNSRVMLGQDIRLLYPDMANIGDAKDSPIREIDSEFSCSRVEIEKVPQVLFANHLTAGIAFQKFVSLLDGKSVDSWSQWISEPRLEVESQIPFEIKSAEEYKNMILQGEISDKTYASDSEYYNNLAFRKDKELCKLNTAEYLFEDDHDDYDEDDHDEEEEYDNIYEDEEEEY